MKELFTVLRETEVAAAKVGQEIESLKLVASLTREELVVKDPFELLRQKEAEVSRVRQEITSLKIVAPLLSEEAAFDKESKMPMGSAEAESRGDDDLSRATGTDNLFSSAIAKPRATFWKLLKRKS